MYTLLNLALWVVTALGSVGLGLVYLGYGAFYAGLPMVIQQVLGAILLVGGLLSLVNFVYHVLGSDNHK